MVKKEIEIGEVGYAVLFTGKLLDTMLGKDNNKLFRPYCIFKTKKEAIEWRNEKYLGYKNNKSSENISKVIIIDLGN